jgi:hypothetical protein
MIECVLTIDYEIYGNGKGSLKELVLEPGEKLRTVLKKFGARAVFFVEAAELECIEDAGTDGAINDVRRQIRDLYQDGFEIGLHLHPQWCTALCGREGWQLNYEEYNLCTLPEGRVEEIVDRGIGYLRKVTGLAEFTPLSFRAGNWLLQPSGTVARALANRGIKIDSSVYKGGVQYQYGLDYRRALKNGYFWRFAEDVNMPDPEGSLLEIPIYSQMVPTWKVFTGRRVGLQQRATSAGGSSSARIGRLRDFMRFKHPLKLDFCRMTTDELRHMIDAVLKEDRDDPDTFRPLVAIGHTKDLEETGPTEFFLDYLKSRGIPVSLFGDVYPSCANSAGAIRTDADELLSKRKAC